MKASASAGEASRHASGWSAAASQSASKAASAAHRSDLARETPRKVSSQEVLDQPLLGGLLNTCHESIKSVDELKHKLGMLG